MKLLSNVVTLSLKKPVSFILLQASASGSAAPPVALEDADAELDDALVALMLYEDDSQRQTTNEVADRSFRAEASRAARVAAYNEEKGSWWAWKEAVRQQAMAHRATLLKKVTLAIVCLVLGSYLNILGRPEESSVVHRIFMHSAGNLFSEVVKFCLIPARPLWEEAYVFLRLHHLIPLR